MDEFAVKVREVPLEIATASGGVLQASFFLHDNGWKGPERLLERLNDAESFLPLRTADGSVQLWRKSAFLRILCWEPLYEIEEFRQAGVRRSPLRISMPGGEILEGTVFLPLPSTRMRVSDLLNGPGRFFLMETDNGAVILNKDGIDAVLPLDGGD
jgi:hypothetical protein